MAKNKAQDQEKDIEDDFEEEAEDTPPEKIEKKEAATKPVKEPEAEGGKLVKRESKEAPIDNKVLPRRAYVLDKKGKQLKAPAGLEDQEGAEDKYELETEYLEYARGKFHRHVGYVNKNGVLFPCNFRFKGGHIADSAPEYAVVLNKCPQCGHRQSIDEAVQGECQNVKFRRSAEDPEGPCGFSAFEELDSYEIKG